MKLESKKLKFMIATIIFFAIITLTLSIGIIAIAQNNLSFNVGIKYDPDLLVAVKIDDKYIFNSKNPVGNERTYIDYISKDTIYLNDSVFSENTDTINLIIENYTAQKVKIIVTTSPTTTISKTLGIGSETTTTETIQVSKSTLGEAIFTVTFAGVAFTMTYINDDTTYTTQDYFVNDTIIEPSNAPTKEGYTFSGWYTDSACTIAYTFGSTVTAELTDMTLYAKFMENVKIYVTFRAGDDFDYSSVNIMGTTQPSTSCFKVEYSVNDGDTITLYTQDSSVNGYFTVPFGASLMLKISFEFSSTSDETWFRSPSWTVSGALADSEWSDKGWGSGELSVAIVMEADGYIDLYGTMII